MVILSVDVNINLDDVNFDEDDPETIICVRLMDWCNRFKQHKSSKKKLSKKLLAGAWYPTRQWDWWMPQDEKKDAKPFFIDEK